MMTILKAVPNDSKEIATYLLHAMEDIVYGFIGEQNYVKALELMRYFTERVDNQYSFQNCWVIEIEEAIVAAVNIYDGASLKLLQQPVEVHIRRFYNKDFVAEEETESGEYYIDALSVKPDLQGRGIGAFLLGFLIDHYVIDKAKTLGLLVDEENSGANRLYLRLGFKNLGSKKIFGKNMAHLQYRPMP